MLVYGHYVFVKAQFFSGFALRKAFATGTISSQPPLISFKRDKNIGNFLVRSSKRSLTMQNLSFYL